MRVIAVGMDRCNDVNQSGTGFRLIRGGFSPFVSLLYEFNGDERAVFNESRLAARPKMRFKDRTAIVSHE